jgi:hypothetical protein
MDAGETHLQIFEREWRAPGRTIAELPPVDVNRVLEEHYDVKPFVRLTRTMLWDMEVRKAKAPDVFIPTVVVPNTLHLWGPAADVPRGRFMRVSDQALWVDPSVHGTVIEDVELDHDRHTAIFLGQTEAVDTEGRPFVARAGQPIFHVDHSVSGPEDQPLNHWRIVHLTEAPNHALQRVFARMAGDKWLRIFVEIYVREVLGAELTRREPGPLLASDRDDFDCDTRPKP